MKSYPLHSSVFHMSAMYDVHVAIICQGDCLKGHYDNHQCPILHTSLCLQQIGFSTKGANAPVA